MGNQVIIQREPAGFTLHAIGKGRIEVDNDFLSEAQALDVFSERFHVLSPKQICPEEYDGDVLLEGIDTVIVKRDGKIQSCQLDDLFSGAIEIMLKEANEQQSVTGYLPVLGQGSFSETSFRKFFYLTLKNTKECPKRIVFPEFSVKNPLTSGTAEIGGAGGRMFGIIQDNTSLANIQKSIAEAISRHIGEKPDCISADNYYLKN